MRVNSSFVSRHVASIAVADLLPNPFRHLDRYPLNQDKVDALKQSIAATKFWDNLVVRKSPDQPGKYEIAYGHHRIEALRQLNEPTAFCHVKEIDDTRMAQMMAQENREEWTATADVMQETVRGVVEGYAAGRIKFPALKGKTPKAEMRFAPSFRCGADVLTTSGAHPYSAETLREFLGWPLARVRAVLTVLQAEERELVSTKDLSGLTTWKAAEVVTEAKRIYDVSRDKALARKASNTLAKAVRENCVGRSAELKEMATEILPKNLRKSPRRKPPKIPRIERFINQVAAALEKIPSSKMRERLQGLVDCRDDLVAAGDDLTDAELKTISTALRAAAKRFEYFADRLEGLAPSHVAPNTPALPARARLITAAKIGDGGVS
jgi:hypothetical protein